MKPIVAIVGRPNVGKSTLFNRIIGSRQAITLDQPGVSRDRHYGHAFWDGHEFVCVDTGGFPLNEKKGMGEKIQRQIEIALAEADVIWFILDGQSGLLPGERELDRNLRKLGKKIIRVVNKIDQTSHESRLADFHLLGEPFPISAEHGYRIGELLDETVKYFPPAEKEAESGKEEIRIALIGRPNVGKSSLLNRLLGEERVVVDPLPGTTRDAIDTVITREQKRYRILDTAGIRRGGKSASDLERFSILKALQAVERAEICLLILDAKEGIHRQDSHVAGYAMEAKKGILILWNKWDLIPVKKGIEKSFQEKVADELRFLAYAPVLNVSAKTGWGVNRLWPTLLSLHESLGRRIKTSEVNRIFEELILAHNRPVYKGNQVKFFYATQTGTYPPTFIVFVNEPKGVHFSYQRYLLNGFRKAFQFNGAPLQIHFRKKN